MPDDEHRLLGTGDGRGDDGERDPERDGIRGNGICQLGIRIRKIGADLDLLSQTAEHIRTYGSLENPSMVPLALNRKLTVMAGAWITRSGSFRNCRCW